MVYASKGFDMLDGNMVALERYERANDIQEVQEEEIRASVKDMVEELNVLLADIKSTLECNCGDRGFDVEPFMEEVKSEMEF